jgi:hypothetical protein
MPTKAREDDWQQFPSATPVPAGSTREWTQWLAREHPELLVPEDHIEMVQCPGWTRAHEEPPKPGETCWLCGGGIKEGSYRYCPKCNDSGHEANLRMQRYYADK